MDQDRALRITAAKVSRAERESKLVRQATGLLSGYAVSKWMHEYSIPVDAMDEGMATHRSTAKQLSATALAYVIKDAPPLLLGEAIYESGAPRAPLHWPTEVRLAAVDINQPKIDLNPRTSSHSVQMPSSTVAIFREERVYDRAMGFFEIDQLEELYTVLKAMGAYYADADDGKRISLDTLLIPDVSF